MFHNSIRIGFKACTMATLAFLFPGMQQAQAQGSDPYIGQILYVGFNFAPVGWNFCDGSVLQITSNDALFALIGTTYGGDGQTTFALPDLQGRVPIHQGQSPGTSNYVIGQRAGAESVTLTTAQMPAHVHSLSFKAPIPGTSAIATSAVPAGHALASTGRNLTYSSSAPNVSLGGSVTLSSSTGFTGNSGGSQPFSIMPPYLTVTCIISLFGVFPSQN
jgi:microcystin-dependent protein